MMRLILALFAICIYSVPALAYPQPSIEAYGEAPEVQHSALSDDGKKVAIFFQLNKKLDPDDEDANGRAFSFPRSLVVYDTTTGETKSNHHVIGDCSSSGILRQKAA